MRWKSAADTGQFGLDGGMGAVPRGLAGETARRNRLPHLFEPPGGLSHLNAALVANGAASR